MTKKRKLISRNANRVPVSIKKDNPFEKRKIKKKHVVMGQPLKTEEAIGQIRSQAIEQRKKTLLVEYKERGHVNAFIDKRIGEKDESLTQDEKMLIRYQKEKQRKLLKRSLFSLEDPQESLTHLGQSLSELDAFDDPMPSDDEEGIAGEIVSDYHFGGGLLKKVPGTGPTEEKPAGAPRKREEIMNEIIAKSKFYRELHQQQRQETLELTDELDEDLKNLLPHLGQYWRQRDDERFSQQTDDFDLLVKDMAYEARAKPLERLPTDAEIAQKQRDRLEFLEKERVRRMQGILAPGEEDDEEEDQPDFSSDQSGKKFLSSADAIEESDQEADGSDDEDEESEELGDVADAAAEIQFDDDDEEDDEEDIRDEEDAPKQKASKAKGKSDKKANFYQKPLTEREIKMIEASLEQGAVPFLIDIPGSYQDLCTLLANKTSVKTRTILARMMASNAASLGANYKAKIEHLLEMLVQYFLEYVPDMDLEFIDVISGAIYRIAQASGEAAAGCFVRHLLEMNDRLSKHLASTSEDKKHI